MSPTTSDQTQNDLIVQAKPAVSMNVSSYCSTNQMRTDEKQSTRMNIKQR